MGYTRRDTVVELLLVGLAGTRGGDGATMISVEWIDY